MSDENTTPRQVSPEGPVPEDAITDRERIDDTLQLEQHPPTAGLSARAAAVCRQVEVVRPGPLATVQDLGRPGLGAVGVPPSGAADASSLAAANLLAGNPPGAAGLELTMGRAMLRCHGGLRLALAGAPAPVAVCADPGEPGVPVPPDAAFDVPDGWFARIGAPPAGLRSYLAVAGGILIPAVLGSRSADLHSGLGGGRLRAGDLLPVGRLAPGRPGRNQPAGVPGTTPIPARGEVTTLRVVPGPRTDWFAPETLAVLCGCVYTVSQASNRTGLRLDGPALPRSGRAELASEGMMTGSLQVPHDGRPILLLPDRPTTGGYPVIAVVVSADIGVAGQLRPGDQLRFAVPPGPGQPPMAR